MSDVGDCPDCGGASEQNPTVVCANHPTPRNDKQEPHWDDKGRFVDENGRKWVMETSPLTHDDCTVFDGEPHAGKVRLKNETERGSMVELDYRCEAHWGEWP